MGCPQREPRALPLLPGAPLFPTSLFVSSFLPASVSLPHGLFSASSLQPPVFFLCPFLCSCPSYLSIRHPRYRIFIPAHSLLISSWLLLPVLSTGFRSLGLPSPQRFSACDIHSHLSTLLTAPPVPSYIHVASH